MVFVVSEFRKEGRRFEINMKTPRVSIWPKCDSRNEPDYMQVLHWIHGAGGGARGSKQPRAG